MYTYTVLCTNLYVHTQTVKRGKQYTLTSSVNVLSPFVTFHHDRKQLFIFSPRFKRKTPKQQTLYNKTLAHTFI